MRCIIVGSTDSDTLDMLRSILGQYLSVATMPCQDAAELSKNIVDCSEMVVLDIAPAHMGLRVELVRQVKAAQAQTKIVAITSQEAMCQAVIGAGADECITKPFDLDVLLDAVNRHLPER